LRISWSVVYERQDMASPAATSPPVHRRPLQGNDFWHL